MRFHAAEGTLDHEYSVLGGRNRSQVGRWLTIVSSGLSALITLGVLTAWDIAKRLGLNHNVPPVLLSLIGAGTVYLVLYWTFDRFIWRWRFVSALLKVPAVAGTWHCDGQTINPNKTPGYVWSGAVTITQSWDKIRVRLKTAQSGSNSVSAALSWDAIDGYRLMYAYANDPNIDEPELKAHRGFAELVFSQDLRSASGEYFNGRGRFTFGTMKLTRA